MPLYWQANSTYQISGSTDLNQFIHFYQLTGNRRARDVVQQFAEAAKRHWTPATMAGDWRILMATRCLAQAYGMTWDPELRAMAEASVELFADPEGEIGLTKDRPYNSSTYKTQSDVGALLDAWEILGDPRLREIALEVSHYLWADLLGKTPLGYNNPVGRIGHLLHEEKIDQSVPEVLAQQLRWFARHYDREKREFRSGINAAAMLYVVEGVAYSQDVLRRAGGWKEPVASSAGCDDFGYPVSFIVRKQDREALTLRLAVPTGSNSSGHAGGGVTVRPLEAKSTWGLDLNTVIEDSNGGATVRLPKDAPAGAYEITPHRQGRHVIVANARAPLVLHAPHYWQPAPPQDPPRRWFFRVPEKARDAQIFFEGSARVFDPEGQPWPGGAPQQGWVNLPADRAGVWSFEAIDDKLVRARNLPPFFALGDATHYFEPPLPWKREPISAAKSNVDAKALYVPGAVSTANNQALQLTGNRSLTLEAGPAHESGEGGTFLPSNQGTIEFFYLPSWSSFDLATTASLLTLATREKPWNLSYLMDPAGEAWFNSRALLAIFPTDGASKARSIRCYRRTLFERGQWVHVAWVWGQPKDFVYKKAGQKVLVTQIYINGAPGQFTPDPVPGNLPAFAPARLRTGAGFNGAIDELRVLGRDALRGALHATGNQPRGDARCEHARVVPLQRHARWRMPWPSGSGDRRGKVTRNDRGRAVLDLHLCRAKAVMATAVFPGSGEVISRRPAPFSLPPNNPCLHRSSP